LFNVIDDFNREALAIDVDFSLPALRVIRSLDQGIEWRGKPAAIRCEKGPEYISGALLAWAERRGIRIDFIRPGKSQQNAYVERFNRTVRCEWSVHYEFDILADIQDYATSWMWSCNHDRLHMALGGIIPSSGWSWPRSSTSGSHGKWGDGPRLAMMPGRRSRARSVICSSTPRAC
jgi:putative transposase